MARKGRFDRGLLSKRDAAGRLVWYVRLWHEGRERRFGSFKAKTEARNFYDDAKRQQRLGRFFPERYQRGGYETVQELLDRHKASRSIRKDQRGEACFYAWWTDWFKGKRLNAITPAALEQTRQHLLTKGSNPEKPRACTPQRVNRYMEWIRHALNVAVRDGILPANPVTKLAMYREPHGRTRFLSVEEEDKLAEKLGPTHAPWIRLAILTGLRRGEQFRLSWSDVDLERGVITLPATKAGEVQYVQLVDEARTILRSMEAIAEAQALANGWPKSPWVFPSKNPGKPLDACNLYRRVFLPAVKELKLDDVTWHTLRHTFASRLAMSGASDYDIASCLRHSSTVLVRRYAHLSPTHLRGVMERLSAFGKPTARAAQKEGQGGPILSGTVTETVTGGQDRKQKEVEAIESIGAPGAT